MQHKVLRLLFSSSNASFLDCMTAIEFKLRIELSKGMVDMILESVFPGCRQLVFVLLLHWLLPDVGCCDIATVLKADVRCLQYPCCDAAPCESISPLAHSVLLPH